MIANELNTTCFYQVFQTSRKHYADQNACEFNEKLKYVVLDGPLTAASSATKTGLNHPVRICQDGLCAYSWVTAIVLKAATYYTLTISARI